MGKISKKGQVTIFIIVGILVIVGIISFFIFKNVTKNSNLGNFAEPYNHYLNCMESNVRQGIDLLEQQGGYIYANELSFEPGSQYAPSSSQLDFNGIGIPYWYYISGNNLDREQVPTKSRMISELSRFVSEGIYECDFREFSNKGIFVDIKDGEIDIDIKENLVEVSMDNKLFFNSEDNTSAVMDKHKISVKSNLGQLFNSALKIYELESENNFLENYTIDTISVNAPTVGFEEGCTPIVFDFPKIRENISEALSANIQFIKIGSNNNDYFTIKNSGISNDINFFYSNTWPTKIEIYGDDFVEPVGLQHGLESLGFCYADYNLVYDAIFPVIIRINNANEFFQFPIIVAVDKNQIRGNSLSGNYLEQEEVICKNRNIDMKIGAIDLDGNLVRSSVSFSCLNERCYLGETKDGGYLYTKVPSCVNGIMEVVSSDYSPGRQIISSNEESSVNIPVKKMYEVNLNLGQVSGDSVVRFVSDDFSASAVYPENKKIRLIEGEYNVSVQSFKNSSITLPATTEEKCFDVPDAIGSSRKCFSTNIPEQTLDRVLIGGGNGFVFIDNSFLKRTGTIRIDVPGFSLPKKVSELSDNYAKLEESILSIGLI